MFLTDIKTLLSKVSLFNHETLGEAFINICFYCGSSLPWCKSIRDSNSEMLTINVQRDTPFVLSHCNAEALQCNAANYNHNFIYSIQYIQNFNSSFDGVYIILWSGNVYCTTLVFAFTRQQGD